MSRSRPQLLILMSSIPMYKTHPAPVKPAPKQTVPPPSEERLRILLVNDCVDVVQQMIDEHELPYKIVEGKLVDALAGTDLWLHKFVTQDPETIQLKDQITTLSKHQDEVLIIGETGTGKELLSRALIGNREGKSVAVNCAGLPEYLIESELFGHVRGAFTGADSDKQGLMSVAKGGLLVLDEIGELPLHVQGKLLRALQDKTIRRVGSNKEEEISCRMAFATNKNIAEMVKQGTFRQDLYARISTFEFHVKPIRQRKCDIEPICSSLPKGKEFYAEHGSHLHTGVLSLEHNVRSIQQHVRRWCVFGKVIQNQNV